MFPIGKPASGPERASSARIKTFSETNVLLEQAKSMRLGLLYANSLEGYIEIRAALLQVEGSN
jgi:hypothetical protein